MENKFTQLLREAEKRWNTQIGYDEIGEILGNDPDITCVGWIDPDEYGFSRNYGFRVDGNPQMYIIEWWANLSKLIVDDLEIYFTTLEIVENVHDRKSIIFYRFGEMVAFIRIKSWGNE